MINIDLLPQENRRNKTKFELPDNSAIFIGAAFILAVLVLDVLLFGSVVFKEFWLKRYTSIYSGVKTDSETAEGFKLKADGYKDNRTVAEDLFAGRTLWALKLAKIAEYIPSGMWLTEMSFKDNKLLIKGAVISFKGEEVGPIKDFVSKLRNDPVFSGGFAKLELDSVTRKKIASWEVLDFSVSGIAVEPKKTALDKKTASKKSKKKRK